MALLPATAGAATQTRDDPSDAPGGGASGKADLRTVTWDVSGSAATLTVKLDESTFGAGVRADIGVHVFIDNTADGLADAEVVFTRNADGSKVDAALRTLNRTLSTASCQDLDGKAAASTAGIAPTIAGGFETVSYSFDASLISGGLASFRWAGFGQAPPDPALKGPWDVMPDAANPDANALNPGDRRCDVNNSGLAVTVGKGIAFPDPPPDPTPTPTPTPEPQPTPTPAPGPGKPVVVLALPKGEPAAGTPTIISAAGTKPAPGTTIVGYDWDMNGDGDVDTSTGTHPYATLLVGASSQTVVVTAIASDFSSGSSTIVVSPAPPARDCRAEMSINVLRIRAACIHRSGGVVIADPSPTGTRFAPEYSVGLNGLVLVSRSPTATIRFDEDARTIVGNGRWDVRAVNNAGGDITWYEGDESGLHWPMPTGVRGAPMHLVSLAAASDCEEHVVHDNPIDEEAAAASICAEVPGGFPVTGRIDLGIDPGTVDATLDVTVSVESGIRVSARAQLRASIVLGGLELESIGFEVENAEMGPVTLRRLAFHFEPPGHGEPPHPGGLWDVAVDLGFESPQFHIAGRMIFIDGRFNYTGADVMFTPGIPIYAGVFLNRFATAFGIDPIRISGGLGASFASVLQINADWAYAAFANGVIALRGSGNATLLGGELANFRMEFWNDGYFAYSGRLGYGYPAGTRPTYSLFGQTDFWVEAEPDGRRARYQGDGDLTVSAGPFSGSAHVLINRHFSAGCLPFFLIQFMHSYDTNETTTQLAVHSCDLSAYSVQPTRPHTGILPPPTGGRPTAMVAIDPPEGRAFTVRAGERALVLQVNGDGGAPVVVLSDPKGKLYIPTSQPDKPVADDDFASAYIPSLNRTLLRVETPIAGEWTVAPQPGSPAITTIDSAEAVAPLKVSANVSGSGRTRLLTWRAPGLDGRTLRFVERGKNVGQTIVSTNKAQGSQRYEIQDGFAGKRTVEAMVEGPDGIPLATPVVARYVAPAPPRPGRIGRLTVKRVGAVVTVRWPKLRAAEGYAIRVTGADGRREVHFPTARMRLLRIRLVAPETKLKVVAAGWIGSHKRTGRSRTATVKALRRKL